MRILITALCLLGWASAALAVPSVARRAAAHGLAGAPATWVIRKSVSPDHHGSVREVDKTWSTPAGRRWEFTSFGPRGNILRRYEGLELTSGMQLHVDDDRRVKGAPVIRVRSKPAP